MTTLRQKMIEDMQLRGLSERTQACYLNAVKQLAKYYHKSPDQIGDEELRAYFVYLRNEQKIARNTYALRITGIRFFYKYTLCRDETILNWIRPPRENKLPVVLSIDEVARVLRCVKRKDYRVCLTLIYACGLRLREAVHLQVQDIDGKRHQVQIRQGKGNKDRYVPISETMLEVLREHWCTHRHRKWLFPSRDGNQENAMGAGGLQKAMTWAVSKSGINKHATIHSLRHSYATYLLESGVNLRTIQLYLGHTSLNTTARYLHLIQQDHEKSTEGIEAMLRDLWH